MKSRVLNADGQKTYVLIFDKGDEVVSTLKEFAGKEQLTGSHIEAIGGLSDVTTGYFDPEKKDYIKSPLERQCEVVSLIGDIAEGPDGKPVPHMHIVVGLPDATTRGGHLLSGHVFPTLEMTLVETPAHLRKKVDPETNLALISL